MPETTTTTVNQNENGQYQTTIPKALADALNLDGEKVTWTVESGKALRMEKSDE
jgi:antitoxin component of MazEF toxin-antitoxin module